MNEKEEWPRKPKKVAFCVLLLQHVFCTNIYVVVADDSEMLMILRS